jgi:hypothetical protein
MAETNRIMSEGLAAGYAGGTERVTVHRGNFDLESTNYTSSDGGEHSDQWIANMTGGGQEIARINGETATRLHAGGTIPLEELAKLGLTKKDVIRFLKQSILEAHGQTRLGENYVANPQDEWQYEYRILDRKDELGLTVGMETITYEGHLVFAHGFLNSPVK